jgi:hypothetical protein
VRKKSTELVPASSASWETLSERFESRLLPAFKRRTEEVGRLLPELYLHGLAQGDFDLASRGAPMTSGQARNLSGLPTVRATKTTEALGWADDPPSVDRPAGRNLSQRMTIQKGQYPMTRPAHPKHRTGGLAS